MKTSKGDIVIQLYPDKAPITVNSFVFLSKQGFYNEVPFHRVIPGFVAQGGDPSGSGIGGPGYAFKDEISDLKYDREGILGMANAGSNTNGSQFFITLAPLPDLNGRYTIFGRVIKGMEVAKSLNSRDASRGDIANPADKIIQIVIEER
ncbi:MAG TPA: peptidylprolyl isomerase [Anaerolineaceae bacterium]